MSRRERTSQVYQIRVRGMVDPSWSDWFAGMAIVSERVSDDTTITTLTGAVADQAVLRGILLKIWDLNLSVIALARVDADAEHRGGMADE
jgi:hypothetical protein